LVFAAGFFRAAFLVVAFLVVVAALPEGLALVAVALALPVVATVRYAVNGDGPNVLERKEVLRDAGRVAISCNLVVLASRLKRRPRPADDIAVKLSKAGS
jgi:hypothetical protein